MLCSYEGQLVCLWWVLIHALPSLGLVLELVVVVCMYSPFLGIRENLEQERH